MKNLVDQVADAMNEGKTGNIFPKILRKDKMKNLVDQVADAMNEGKAGEDHSNVMVAKAYAQLQKVRSLGANVHIPRRDDLHEAEQSLQDLTELEGHIRKAKIFLKKIG